MIRSVRLAMAFLVLLSIACAKEKPRSESAGQPAPLRLQLNWFHDPTFAGEYRTSRQMRGRLVIVEGGVNISPIQQVKSGLADVAVVGIDVALQAIEADLASTKSTPLRIVFADFQRNPVGWIVHPTVAARFGLKEPGRLSGKERNDWLFDQFRKGNIVPGDKRGTETTAVWARWRQIRGLRGVKVTQVGFDPTVVLGAPALAYPVYMNEEPFKLSEKIGAPVVVCDPADDGVVLYGNVLLSTDSCLASKAAELGKLVDVLRESWSWVRSYPDSAAMLVRPLYKDVSDAVLRSQIERTTDFVFYKADQAGSFDLSAGGRMDETIGALKSAGTLTEGRLALASVIPFVWTAEAAR